MVTDDGRRVGSSPRPEIALSWQRSRQSGLAPELSPNCVSISEVDRASRLMSAGQPVLDELTRQLEGTRFSVLLADRDCRIVYRWFGDPRLQRSLEDIGVVLGSQFAEGRIGTNALGTPYESLRAVEVHGEEHFAEALKRFSCYGHPIRHPLTGRIEGVLDITTSAEQGNPLFGPVVARAVNDVRQRMVEGARAAERKLFLAFQQATHRRSAAVAVLGEDVVFANRSCTDQLGSADPTLLRALLPRVPERGRLRTELALPEGARLAVTAERVPGTRDGTVFQVNRIVPSAIAPVPRPRENRGCRTVFVIGEPGTGRSARAREFAGSDPVTVFDAASALTQDPRDWAARFVRHTARAGSVVLVEDVHLLPERLRAVVREALAGGTAARVALTACPAEHSPAAALAAHCGRRVELAPLRARTDELPALAESMLRTERPDQPIRFTPRALAALCAQPWPGNLHELRAVVREVAAAPCAGVIDTEALPARYRGTARTDRLGGRELAERNAIITALSATGGNKLRAASRLGVSRTTLYRRMQALDIDADCPTL
ncbi:MAG TPA: helix-turn-helix domain-containing protein [Pseudonocardiaceae bacterium]|jgi:transcriptional regulator of acetoin/glycerol metabolism|nr:helix-turn-helix domain-containing protein [Pseudonocardiaceae bacterium]